MTRSLNGSVAISVIIATFNRAESLQKCLGALFRQTLPAEEFEVVVVDDGSIDDSFTIATNSVAPCALKVIRQEHSGIGTARNRGVHAADGEFCLFIDDDIVAQPQLLGEHLRIQRAHGGVLGQGHLSNEFPPNADSFVRFFWRGWDDMSRDLARDPSSLTFIDSYSGNLSVPRAAFLDAGGFAIDLVCGLDVELVYRLTRQGLRLLYIPGASAVQRYQKGRKAVISDIKIRGIGELQMYRKHPAMLPHLRLSKFDEMSFNVILLRRVLLAVHAPPLPLTAVWTALNVIGKPRWARLWYGFLMSYCYWYGLQQSKVDRDTWLRLTRAPLVLAYHAFGQEGERASRFVVPASRFSSQVHWLHKRGHPILGLNELLQCRDEYRLPPARAVVITADDGYLDNWTIAFPILRQTGFTATFF